MKSLLTALYSNKFNIAEHINPPNPEYDEVSEILEKVTEKLKNRLPGEEIELFEKIIDLQAEMDMYLEVEIFKSVFSLGVLLMTEVMASKESNLGWD